MDLIVLLLAGLYIYQSLLCNTVGKASAYLGLMFLLLLQTEDES